MGRGGAGAGRITGAKFLGSAVRYTVSAGPGVDVIADAEAGAAGMAVGTDVHVTRDPAVTRAFAYAADPEVGLP